MCTAGILFFSVLTILAGINAAPGLVEGCKFEEFLCKGECIPTNQLCDQSFNCSDSGEDANCTGSEALQQDELSHPNETESVEQLLYDYADAEVINGNITLENIVSNIADILEATELVDEMSSHVQDINDELIFSGDYINSTNTVVKLNEEDVTETFLNETEEYNMIDYINEFENISGKAVIVNKSISDSLSLKLDSISDESAARAIFSMAFNDSDYNPSTSEGWSAIDLESMVSLLNSEGVDFNYTLLDDQQPVNDTVILDENIEDYATATSYYNDSVILDIENGTVDVTFPPIVTSTEFKPSIILATTMPTTSSETTVPATSSETSVPVTSSVTSMPVTSLETSVPVISSEATAPETSSEVTMPETSSEVTVPETSSATTVSTTELVTTTMPPTTPPTTVTTTTPTTTTHNPCNRDEFHCIVTSSYETECIPIEWKCDHMPDCYDGSDELLCDADCPSNMVKCPDSGKCIHGSWICDGHYDCDNGSDELYC